MACLVLEVCVHHIQLAVTAEFKKPLAILIYLSDAMMS